MCDGCCIYASKILMTRLINPDFSEFTWAKWWGTSALDSQFMLTCFKINLYFTFIIGLYDPVIRFHFLKRVLLKQYRLIAIFR